MREFIILKHNNNSLIRLLIIVLTIVLSVLISNYIKLSYLAGIAPTAIVILACVIHHIHYENYKEVGEFYFTEEGIYIHDYLSECERLIPTFKLERVLVQYHGYHGQEHQSHPLNLQTTTDFGDNNFIQIETSTERIRYRFYGNNAGDTQHINKWSDFYSKHSVVMKSAHHLSAPRFIGRIFDEPLS